jgi:hypothetical protein
VRHERGSSAELRPCLGQGASLGEEAALADSGREGEITARVGRVRSLVFLSILLKIQALSPSYPSQHRVAQNRVFPRLLGGFATDRHESCRLRMILESR